MAAAASPVQQQQRYVLGVAAMDCKARSKPMREILARVVAAGDVEVLLFGDKVLLDEDVGAWPVCDFLITFFSAGFPIDKALRYITLRKPYLVNDLLLQKILWDRRAVLAILDQIGVPTPFRVLVNRSDPAGPSQLLDRDAVAKVKRTTGVDVDRAMAPTQSVVQLDYDTLEVDGARIVKPFVEKPVSGEDHNIYVYFHSTQGGGCRKLFRKVANKSSEFCPDVWQVRTQGSFIYEEFCQVDNAEDVKVYTIGANYAHAETRKSPVVDGVVQRNHDGKEIRYVTQLTPAEKEYSRRVATAFGQTICGFDLLRTGGRSYVIDVNGWSFVKGHDGYYAQCAAILRRMFLATAKRMRAQQRIAAAAAAAAPDATLGVSASPSSWRLKGFFSVLRHGDRTPKLKHKFNHLRTPAFVALLNGGRDEVILKGAASLARVIEAAEASMTVGGPDHPDAQLLHSLVALLHAKDGKSDTKVQIKPTWSKTEPDVLDKLQLIVKWGGTFTHAGALHTRDLAENLRKDLQLINRELLDDVVVYSASETRVVQTAEVFLRSFVAATDGAAPGSIAPLLPEIEVRREMLDDSNAAKEQMEDAKRRIQRLDDLAVPAGLIEAILKTLRELREAMRANYSQLNVDAIMPEWCCQETPALFRERWEKLFRDFLDAPRFDPCKVSDLYDSLKYDALHNRTFASRIFSSSSSTAPSSPGAPAAIPTTTSSAPSPVPPAAADTYPPALRDLFKQAKQLFDAVAPREYGWDDATKLDIGLRTSQPLLRQILADLLAAKTRDSPSTHLYFTKESHVTTLLNMVYRSGLAFRVPQPELEELDYLTQITFEVSERVSPGAEPEFAVRVSFSPGAFCADLVDLHVDDRHAISAQPKRDLTEHIPLDDVVRCLSALVRGDTDVWN